MKNIEKVLLMVGGVGLIVAAFYYRDVSYIPSDACLIYQAFATSVAKWQWSEVQNRAMGQAQKSLAERQRKTAALVVQQGREKAELSVGGQVKSTSYKIESDEVRPDTARITAVQTVERGSTLTETKWLKYRHTVLLRKIGGLWRVDSFLEEDLN